MNISLEEMIFPSMLIVAYLSFVIVSGMMGWFDSMAGRKDELERSMERFVVEKRVSEPNIRNKNGGWIKGLRVVDNRSKWREKFTAVEVDSISEVRIVKTN